MGIIKMIKQTIVKWGMIAIFLFMTSNGIISFPPSEIILSFAGTLTIDDNKYFVIILLGAMFSNYVGTSFLYFLGKKTGRSWYDRIIDQILRKKLSFLDKYVPTTQDLIDFFNNQEWLIFACRFLPFIRSIISIPAGICEMNFLKFTLYTILGMLVWSFTWLWVGRTTVVYIKNGRTYIILLLVLLFLISGIIGKLIRNKIRNR